MEDDWQETLAGFEDVWQRVQGGEAPATSAPQDRARAALEALMRALARAAASYRAAGLFRLAGACFTDLRQLRAEYFLLYGADFALPELPSREALFLRRLRRAWLDEAAVGAAWDAVAVTAGEPGLRKLCAGLSKCSEQRKQAVFGLLCRIL